MSIIYDRNLLKAKAIAYCDKHNTVLSRELGFGTQGIVYKTQHNTALKVYDLRDGYEREVGIYRRLKERKISSVRGLSIPRIVNVDDKLLAFEMSIVHVPCLIDFGGAYLDNPPQHMCRDDLWTEQKAEEFGDNWEEAQKVIKEIEYRADIWLADINTGNIKFYNLEVIY